jgi:DNA-binding NarL/FixJ family response regulator
VQPAPVSVLVADDLASFRRAARAVIEATEGFEVAGLVESGEAALELLAGRHPVDMVLLDVHMPGMGGVRAASEIERRFPALCVVLLSVHSREDLPAAAQHCGARFCDKADFGPEALEELWRSR